MLDADWLVAKLRDLGVSFWTGVPDSVLKSLSVALERNREGIRHLIAANEGTAVGLAIGYHLATSGIPLVYLQNAGLGNAVNPLVSLADPRVYGIPMLLLIGWRGEPRQADEPQHRPQGEATLPMLAAMDIPHQVLPAEPQEAAAALAGAIRIAREGPGPSALVVRRGTLQGLAPQIAANRLPLGREEAVACVLSALRTEDLTVASTGMISRELAEMRETAGGGHEGDFLTIGGMGHASQIALSLALHRPERRVLCLDGDGAALMHLGGWATIGQSGAENFLHLMLNNGTHDSVGGQPTGAFDIDFPAIARACGYAKSTRVQTREALQAALASVDAPAGPTLIEIRVRTGHRKDLGRPALDPSTRKELLIHWIEAGGA